MKINGVIYTWQIFKICLHLKYSNHPKFLDRQGKQCRSRSDCSCAIPSVRQGLANSADPDQTDRAWQTVHTQIRLLLIAIQSVRQGLANSADPDQTAPDCHSVCQTGLGKNSADPDQTAHECHSICHTGLCKQCRPRSDCSWLPFCLSHRAWQTVQTQIRLLLIAIPSVRQGLANSADPDQTAPDCHSICQTGLGKHCGSRSDCSWLLFRLSDRAWQTVQTQISLLLIAILSVRQGLANNADPDQTAPDCHSVCQTGLGKQCRPRSDCSWLPFRLLDRAWQTVQTQIRQMLGKQCRPRSDRQGSANSADPDQTDRTWQTVQTQIRMLLIAMPSVRQGLANSADPDQTNAWQTVQTQIRQTGLGKQRRPRSDRQGWQTVQTQIRLLLIAIPSVRQGLANSSDQDQTAPEQGLNCLPFHLHLLDALPGTLW